MIAVDTNVLVRLFVSDDEDLKQRNLVRRLVKSQDAIYVSQIVQIELVWVLESNYKFSKEQVIEVLNLLDQHSAIILEANICFQKALEIYRSGDADFSDYVIFVNADNQDYSLWTFDKKLARTDRVNRLHEESLTHLE